MEPNKPLPWQLNRNEPYWPIYYEDQVVVGFCRPEYAPRLVELLNDEEKLRKALHLACLDLIKQSDGDPTQVQALIKKYIKKTERPKYGTAAIAFLLRDRQEELDVSDKEFARFCDSYKLSPEALKNIYTGKKIEDSLLIVLSRILGKSVEELAEVRDGTNHKSDSR
jgi:hypothetical protein